MSLCVKRSPPSINRLQLIHLLQFRPFSTSPPPLPPSFIVSRSETNSHENPSTFRSFLRWVSGIALGSSVGLVGYLSSSEKSFLAFADWSTAVTAEVSVDDHQTSNPKFLFGGTFRKFKENYAHQNPSAHETKSLDNSMEDLCANIKVGDRCQVEPGEKRGVVKFVGRAEALGSGFWVGVQYDEPLGKHDGMVKGTRYFDCPPLHGGMVRPDKIKVGDYPERDPFEEEEI